MTRLVPATVAAFVSLAATVLMTGCSSTVEVATVNSQREANSIVATLLGYQLNAQLETKSDRRNTWYVLTVPADSVAAARQILAANGLPREPASTVAAGSSPLGPPGRDEERLRVAEMMGQSIRAEIERLPGVTDVSVLVNIPARDVIAVRAAPTATHVSVVVQGHLSGTGERSVGGLSEADFSTMVERFVAGIDGVPPVVRVQLVGGADEQAIIAAVENAREAARVTALSRRNTTVAVGALCGIGLVSGAFLVSRRRRVVLDAAPTSPRSP